MVIRELGGGIEGMRGADTIFGCCQKQDSFLSSPWSFPPRRIAKINKIINICFYVEEELCSSASANCFLLTADIGLITIRDKRGKRKVYIFLTGIRRDWARNRGLLKGF
jgi:hypothetical protein